MKEAPAAGPSATFPPETIPGGVMAAPSEVHGYNSPRREVPPEHVAHHS